jgi:hypothetical protein
MYTATGFYFVCYIPELYANYKNKNANCYNVPEKILLFIGSILALSYAVQLGDISIITNYGLAVGIDIIALSMRIYYSYHSNINNQPPQIEELKELQNVSTIEAISDCIESGQGAESLQQLTLKGALHPVGSQSSPKQPHSGCKVETEGLRPVAVGHL